MVALGLSFRAMLCVSAALLQAVATRNVPVTGNDSAAIEAAIAKARSGDTVELPAGTFALSRAIRPSSGINIIGAGAERTVLHFVGDRPDVAIDIENAHDVELSAFTIDGQNNPKLLHGIVAGNSHSLLIHDLTIRNLAKNDVGYGQRLRRRGAGHRGVESLRRMIAVTQQ